MATKPNKDDSAHRKLALLIGNGMYSHASNRLIQSKSNVEDLSEVLSQLGFHVTRHIDETKESFAIIKEFAKTVNEGDFVFVYYCGHGCQIMGENYLIAVQDADIESERDIEDIGLSVNRLIKRLAERNSTYANIIVLDCPKPYILTNKERQRYLNTDLTEVKPPKGTLIQFACNADFSSNEYRNTDRNDLFTKQLLKNVMKERVNVVDILDVVAQNVEKESKSKQKSLIMNGLRNYESIYLNSKLTLTVDQFWSDEPLAEIEKRFYQDAKDYCRLTEEPLISIPDEVFDNTIELKPSCLVFGVDEEAKVFDLDQCVNNLCERFGFDKDDIQMKKIQKGSCICVADIFGRFLPKDRRIRIKMAYERITDSLRKYLAKMKVFFMFLGSEEALDKIQKLRSEIRLNPQYNRIYACGHDYWDGPLGDGRDRGGQPYFCPVGWQRTSFYVVDDFYQKFKGWCICYHGTKFVHGLSILLSGLKPAKIKAHGDGVYFTPSVNYAAHPRYAEVKKIPKESRNTYFNSGKYVQFLLECRIQPNNIYKIGGETLGATNTIIDSNISNENVEWLLDTKNKDLVDFNDPASPVVCSGILMRVTTEHPGLLPESEWWFKSHLCNNGLCCVLGIDLNTLNNQRSERKQCTILFDKLNP